MGTVSVHHLAGVGWGDLLDWCRSGGVLGVDGRHDHSREAETENTSTEGGDDGLDEELSGQVHERGRVVGVCPPYLSIIGAGRPWWQWVQLYYIGAHRGLIRVSDALLTNWGALCYDVQDYCKHQQMAVLCGTVASENSYSMALLLLPYGTQHIIYYAISLCRV